MRTIQLVGYGLVVGLDGTGDQTTQAPFTIQSVENLLQRFGVTVPPNTNPQLKNVAAVTVTADLPPFVKPGQTIDVTVGTIGNASSLRGGNLIMAPLRGADGQIYAIAQGNVVVSGFGVKGSGARATSGGDMAGGPSGPWPGPHAPPRSGWTRRSSCRSAVPCGPPARARSSHPPGQAAGRRVGRGTVGAR